MESRGWNTGVCMGCAEDCVNGGEQGAFVLTKALTDEGASVAQRAVSNYGHQDKIST